MRIANKNAREAIKHLKEFKANNLFAVREKSIANPANWKYVVYSYGYHFPIYTCLDKWYVNKDKYSVSTSRHQNQCKPEGIELIYLSTEDMKAL